MGNSQYYSDSNGTFIFEIDPLLAKKTCSHVWDNFDNHVIEVQGALPLPSSTQII